MKKIFSFLLMAAVFLAGGASMTSCSSNDDEDRYEQDNSKEVSDFLGGKEWYWGEGGRTYSFYRNHMVVRDAGGVSVGGGVGGYDWGFGTWQVVNGNLVTKFDVCANSKVDLSQLFNDTIYSVYRDPTSQKIKGNKSNGSEAYLSLHKQMADYTDDTPHDKALHGTWGANVHDYTNNVDLQCTMTINPDGTARFTMSDGRSDINTTYTAKNGHVTFANYLTADIQNQSFIYLRNEMLIQLIDEKDALVAWRWYKK